MQRILITGFFALPAPGRAGVQMGHVLRALSPLYEVDVLVVRAGEQAYVERQGSARILRVPMPDEAPRARIETFRRALRRQLEGADYDFVHFRDGWSGMPVLEMRQRLGYTAIFDATRAPLAETARRDPRLRADLARDEESCLRGADHVLVPSEAARNLVLRQRSRGVHRVPAGVDVDLFDWDDPAPGPPAVLYAGTIEAGRGIQVLLRAMADVVTSVDARLLLVGRIAPGFEQALQGTIDELGLQGRVVLVGEVAHDAMPAVNARARVCVAPAAADLDAQPLALYPTKLLEYMACRRAVVAPRRATASMLIESGTHGLLFIPGDAVDLAHKLLCVLQDPELCESLAEAGYQMVRQHHTASATRRALRQAYAAMGAVSSQQPASTREEITSPAAPRGLDRDSTDEILPLFAQRTMKLQVRPGAQADAQTDSQTGVQPAPGPKKASAEARIAIGIDISAADEPGLRQASEAGSAAALEPAALEPAEITPSDVEAVLPIDQEPRTDEQPVLAAPASSDGAPGAASEVARPMQPAGRPNVQPSGQAPGQPSPPRPYDEEIFWSRFEPVRTTPVQDADGDPLAAPRPVDDEGTPVDGIPLTLITAPEHEPAPDDDSIVAGELEAQGPLLDAMLEDETSFTAVSPLLGSPKDDTE